MQVVSFPVDEEGLTQRIHRVQRTGDQTMYCSGQSSSEEVHEQQQQQLEKEVQSMVKRDEVCRRGRIKQACMQRIVS